MTTPSSRQQPRELGAVGAQRVVERGLVDPAVELSQRFDDRAERQPVAELEATADQREATVALDLQREFAHEACLADARFAGDEHGRSPLVLGRGVVRGPQPRQLGARPTKWGLETRAATGAMVASAAACEVGEFGRAGTGSGAEVPGDPAPAPAGTTPAAVPLRRPAQFGRKHAAES